MSVFLLVPSEYNLRERLKIEVKCVTISSNLVPMADFTNQLQFSFSLVVVEPGCGFSILNFSMHCSRQA